MKPKFPAFGKDPKTQTRPASVVLAGADLSPGKAILLALGFLQEQDRLRIAGLWDPVPPRGERAAELLRLPADRRLLGIEDAIRASAAGGKPDAVLVLGGIERRTEAMRQVLKGRIHVLADAPLAPSAAEAESLLEAAAAAGVHLGVVHAARYESVHAEPLGFIRNRRLGEILLVRSERPRAESAEEDASTRELLAELYPDIYLARAWANSPVASVFARAEIRCRRKKAAAVSVIVLQHAGGGCSIVQQTAAAGFASVRCEIFGAEESVRILPQENIWLLTRDTEKNGEARWERMSLAGETLQGGQTMEELPFETGARPYARALDDAFSSLARNLPPPVDGREGWLNLRVLDAAAESARSGEAVRVEIPFPR